MVDLFVNEKKDSMIIVSITKLKNWNLILMVVGGNAISYLIILFIINFLSQHKRNSEKPSSSSTFSTDPRISSRKTEKETEILVIFTRFRHRIEAFLVDFESKTVVLCIWLSVWFVVGSNWRGFFVLLIVVDMEVRPNPTADNSSISQHHLTSSPLKQPAASSNPIDSTAVAQRWNFLSIVLFGLLIVLFPRLWRM